MNLAVASGETITSALNLDVWDRAESANKTPTAAMVANAQRTGKTRVNGYANSNRATIATTASTSMACFSATAKCATFASRKAALEMVKNAVPKWNAAAKDAEKLMEAARAESANGLGPSMLGNRAFILKLP